MNTERNGVIASRKMASTFHSDLESPTTRSESLKRLSEKTMGFAYMTMWKVEEWDDKEALLTMQLGIVESWFLCT